MTLAIAFNGSRTLPYSRTPVSSNVKGQVILAIAYNGSRTLAAVFIVGQPLAAMLKGSDIATTFSGSRTLATVFTVVQPLVMQ